MKKITLILISLFLLSINANAQWENIGGISEEDCLYNIFGENDTLYVISDYEMYRSYDYAENWIKSDYSDTYGQFNEVINFGHRDSTFVAITVNGIYISYNYGNAWSRIPIYPSCLGHFGNYRSFSTSVFFNDNDIYANNETNGTFILEENDSVFRLIYGNGWNKIRDLYVKDSLTLYYNIDTLFVTTDNGTSWIWSIDPFQVNGSRFGFFTHYDDIYYCHSDGFLRSSDGGASWLDITNTLPITGTIKNFLVRDDIWFLGTEDSILMKSIDFGNNWTICNMGLPKQKSTHRISDIYIDGRDYYLSFTNCIYKSTNQGLNWKHKSNGMPVANCYKMNAIGDTLIASYRDDSGGLYRSSDNGISWESINQPFLSFVNEIKTDNGKFYVSDQEGLLVTQDRGDTWERIFNQEGIFTFDVEDNTFIISVIYYNICENYISKDGGQTWNQFYYNLYYPNLIENIKIIENEIMAKNGINLYYANDRNHTFSCINQNLGNSVFYFDFDGTNIVLATWHDVFFSDDLGATWDTITPDNMPYDMFYYHPYILEDTIIIGNRIDTLVYCEIGVWNWQKYTDGLTHPPGYNLFENDSYLFTTTTNGLYRRELYRPPSIIIPPEVEVLVYPNPSNDIFHVVIDDDALVDKKIYQITIYNMQFQEMSTIYPAKTLSEISINCAGLRPGMYIVSINAGDKVYSQRFVKE